MSENILDVIKKSQLAYLHHGARSNEKLRSLHGKFANDIAQRTAGRLKVNSLGYGPEKEETVEGIFYPKKVDILISDRSGKPKAAIALKFVMSNYSQNANNYFESSLGETTNIREAGVPCFQVLVLPERLPYFDQSKRITKWENITKRNISKYIKLSRENPQLKPHVPNKLLFLFINFQEPREGTVVNFETYKQFYLQNQSAPTYIHNASFDFGNSLIFNDYERFIDEVVRVAME
jgi:hypothetical protein